jgi:hypothetical protein
MRTNNPFPNRSVSILAFFAQNSQLKIPIDFWIAGYWLCSSQGRHISRRQPWTGHDPVPRGRDPKSRMAGRRCIGRSGPVVVMPP